MVLETPHEVNAYLASAEGRYMSSVLGYLNEQSVPTRFDAFEDFTIFSAQNFERLREDNHVFCLADLILRWMTDGDATIVCPSYEIYLRTIIEIIATWNGERDLTAMRATSLGSPVRARGLFDDDREFDEAPLLPTLTRPGAELDATNHPAFDHTVYEMARARRQITGPPTGFWAADPK